MPASRAFSVPSLAIAAVLALGACSSGSPSGSNSNHGPVTMTIRAGASPVSLDLQASQVSTVGEIAIPAYDRLLALGPNALPVPYLAKSWTQSPTQIVFKLRTDTTCPDGSKITPSVVQQSFQRLITVPKTFSQTSTLFGPGPYHLSSSDADNTFTFSSDTPNRNMLSGFTYPFTGIICPAGFKALQTDPKALVTSVYGSGPYALTSYASGDQAVFQKRKDWTWGPSGKTAANLPDTLIEKFVENDTTAANLLLTGAIDLGSVTGPDVARLKAAPNLTYKVAPQYQVFGLVFNMTPGKVLTDEPLRQAIMRVIDTHAYAKVGLGTDAVWSSSFFPPFGECYDKQTQSLLPKPDVAAAQSILQNGGYTISGNTLLKNGKQVTVRFIASTGQIQNPDYVITMLTSLGIKVDSLVSAGNAFTQSYVGNNFDISTFGRAQVTNDPGAELPLVAGEPPPKGVNIPRAGFGDTTYTGAVSEGLTTLGKTSCDAFAVVQEQQIKMAYFLPLGAPSVVHFAAKNVSYLPLGNNSYYEVAYFSKS